MWQPFDAAETKPHLGAGSGMNAAENATGGLMDRVAWLERALAELPAPTRSGDWKENVLHSQARRDAEYALASMLQSMQQGRATITVSDRTGTSIRMFGVRAASSNGFEEACRQWIKVVRQQTAGEAAR